MLVSLYSYLYHMVGSIYANSLKADMNLTHLNNPVGKYNFLSVPLQNFQYPYVYNCLFL